MSNRDFSLDLSVLKVKQPIGDFYIASIPAEELVRISFSDVRRLAKEQRDVEKYLGIQRPVSKTRIAKLKQYMTADDATFPTAVILSVNELCAEYEDLGGSFGKLTLHPYFPSQEEGGDEIPINKIAKVIDGQHRIAAFMDENKNWEFKFSDRSFDINVAIFIGADLSEQANIFATVNLAQTKVNKSLVYDLTELAETPSPYKTCHNVAVVLDDEKSSPLHGRIKRLGTATPGREYEPLTQASFVEALVRFISIDPVQDRNDLLSGKKLRRADQEMIEKCPFRNLFIDGNDLDIAEIVYNYFEAVRQRWPVSWAQKERKGNLLPKSNAFKALMRYLKEDVYLQLVGNQVGRVPKTSEFASFFEHIDLTDDDFTIRNFAPGSGGQSRFLKMLRGEITLDDMVDKEK